MATRARVGQPWSAYLKISEGCDRPCTFCVIPEMRGDDLVLLGVVEGDGPDPPLLRGLTYFNSSTIVPKHIFKDGDPRQNPEREGSEAGCVPPRPLPAPSTQKGE